ncbi:protein of unknown function [Nitrospira japonica]|uniref:Uncharacterized protein n=1 Tax=Nitrospira japonica TaxID=1325564 RepID=A0A1W1I4D0_9BACT|nr:protein of unknown function [Nitrospira japonica]
MLHATCETHERDGGLSVLLVTTYEPSREKVAFQGNTASPGQVGQGELLGLSGSAKIRK